MGKAKKKIFVVYNDSSCRMIPQVVGYFKAWSINDLKCYLLRHDVKYSDIRLCSVVDIDEIVV